MVQEFQKCKKEQRYIVTECKHISKKCKQEEKEIQDLNEVVFNNDININLEKKIHKYSFHHFY